MPSGSPASAIAPPAAISSRSLAFHPLRGPALPNGRIATTTRRGWLVRSTPGSSTSHDSKSCGVSRQMSAVASRSPSRSRPAALLRSSSRTRLLTLKARHSGRLRSVPGRSSLMTSAPRSARMRAGEPAEPLGRVDDQDIRQKHRSRFAHRHPHPCVTRASGGPIFQRPRCMAPGVPACAGTTARQ